MTKIRQVYRANTRACQNVQFYINSLKKRRWNSLLKGSQGHIIKLRKGQIRYMKTSKYTTLKDEPTGVTEEKAWIMWERACESQQPRMQVRRKEAHLLPGNCYYVHTMAWYLAWIREHSVFIMRFFLDGTRLVTPWVHPLELHYATQ